MACKYIIDVDTGVDDAQALILALSKPDIQVLGVTCVAGNCNVDQVCLNTLKVLTVCDRLDVSHWKVMKDLCLMFNPYPNTPF